MQTITLLKGLISLFISLAILASCQGSTVPVPTYAKDTQSQKAESWTPSYSFS